MFAPAEAAVFALLLERPDEPGPHAVLADMLLERMHPLGELMALSLRARRSRLKLAKRRRPPSLRLALEDMSVGMDWVALRRGLPDRVRLRPGADLDAIRTHPLWGTVRKLEVRDGSHLDREAMLRWAARVPWRWLTHLHFRDHSHLTMLPELGFTRFVGLSLPGPRHRELQTLIDPEVWPNLRELDLRGITLSLPAWTVLARRPWALVTVNSNGELDPAPLRALAKGGTERMRLKVEGWVLEVDLRSWNWIAVRVAKQASASLLKEGLNRLPREMRHSVKTETPTKDPLLTELLPLLHD